MSNLKFSATGTASASTVLVVPVNLTAVSESSESLRVRLSSSISSCLQKFIIHPQVASHGGRRRRRLGVKFLVCLAANQLDIEAPGLVEIRIENLLNIFMLKASQYSVRK